MATTAICGYTGSVSLCGEVTRWEFSEEQETPEATSMGSSGFKEYIACLKSASGTYDTLIACGSVGSNASVVFTNSKKSYTADIIITDLTCSVDVNDVIKFTYSWVSTGEVS